MAENIASSSTEPLNLGKNGSGGTRRLVTCSGAIGTRFVSRDRRTRKDLGEVADKNEGIEDDLSCARSLPGIVTVLY
jgi:hypothetical protein